MLYADFFKRFLSLRFFQFLINFKILIMGNEGRFVCRSSLKTMPSFCMSALCQTNVQQIGCQGGGGRRRVVHTLSLPQYPQRGAAKWVSLSLTDSLRRELHIISYGHSKPWHSHHETNLRTIQIYSIHFSFEYIFVTDMATIIYCRYLCIRPC